MKKKILKEANGCLRAYEVFYQKVKDFRGDGYAQVSDPWVIKDEVMNLMVNKYQAEYPNAKFQINIKDYREKDLKELLDELVRQSRRARKTSHEEIQKTAKHCLPTIWGKDGRKQLKLRDILQDKKLTLSLWTDRSWDSKTRFGYHSQTYVAALSKLIKITLHKHDPVTVTADYLFPINDEITGKKVDLYSNNLESFRAYKNGKVEIVFTDAESARKIAKALLK